MTVSKNLASLYSGEPTIEITGSAGLSSLCTFISPYNLPGVDPEGAEQFHFRMALDISKCDI